MKNQRSQDANFGRKVCPACHGWKTVQVRDAFWGIPMTVMCNLCHGTGYKK